jgi:hypothetical protein
MSDPELVHGLNPLLALLKECVVRLDDFQGRFRGTGFYVAANRIVTCAHVVEGLDEVKVTGSGLEGTGHVVVCSPRRTGGSVPVADHLLPDLALVDVDYGGRECSHPCVQLGYETPVVGRDGDELYIAGYTFEHSEDRPLLTGVLVELDAWTEEDGVTLLKVRGGQIASGFSGAPLLNRRSCKVVGIVESTRGRQSDLGGFAVSASDLSGAFPCTEKANADFHASSNSRWAEAASREGQLELARSKVASERGLSSRDLMPDELVYNPIPASPASGELVKENPRLDLADRIYGLFKDANLPKHFSLAPFLPKVPLSHYLQRHPLRQGERLLALFNVPTVRSPSEAQIYFIGLTTSGLLVMEGGRHVAVPYSRLTDVKFSYFVKRVYYPGSKLAYWPKSYFICIQYEAEHYHISGLDKVGIPQVFNFLMALVHLTS